MIIRNVHGNVFNDIEYAETASDMIRLKSSYYDQQADTAYWIKKLNSLKPQNKYELLKVLDKMSDIFHNMKKTDVKISNKEKIKYIYNILPHKYRDIVNLDESIAAEKYYTKLKMKINMKAYLEDWNNNNEEYNTDQNIEINYVGKTNNKTHSYKNKNTNYINKQLNNKNKMYCHICQKHNHNTNRCRFSLLTRRNNKNNLRQNINKIR